MDGVLLIFVLLASVGFAHMIVESPMFEYVRSFLKFWLPEKVYQVISCHSCCGIFTGAFFGCLFFGEQWPHVLACAAASSFLAHFSAMWLNMIEARSIVELNNTIDKEKHE